jgi:hypothetical protein
MLDFGQREIMPMAEETTAHFIFRRKRELTSQIAALRGQLTPKEAELEQLVQMERHLGMPAELAIQALPPQNSNATTDYVTPLKAFLDSSGSETRDDQYSKYQSMTIKELAIQALLDHFPTGASLALLRDFIRDAYRRVIEPSSLRPQMHRLKADGILIHDPANDLWNLKPRQRVRYTIFPASRAAIKELQDDEPVLDAEGNPLDPSDPEYLTRLAESLAWKDEDEEIKPPEPDQKTKEASKKSTKEGLDKITALMMKKKRADGFLDD